MAKKAFHQFRDSFTDALFFQRKGQLSAYQVGKMGTVVVASTLPEEGLRHDLASELGTTAEELRERALDRLSWGTLEEAMRAMEAILSADGLFLPLAPMKDYIPPNLRSLPRRQVEQFERLEAKVNAESAARKRRAELKVVEQRK